MNAVLEKNHAVGAERARNVLQALHLLDWDKKDM